MNMQFAILVFGDIVEVALGGTVPPRVGPPFSGRDYDPYRVVDGLFGPIGRQGDQCRQIPPGVPSLLRKQSEDDMVHAARSVGVLKS
jgi:hypothetical protein